MQSYSKLLLKEEKKKEKKNTLFLMSTLNLVLGL